MSTESLTASDQVPYYAPPHDPWARSSDHTLSDDADIKQSFLLFSLKVHELDEQLGRFAKSCMKLDRAAGLLLVIKETRENLRHTREVFFHNATALVPDLLELARKDCNSETHTSNSERFYIPLQYFDRHLQFSALPTALEKLGASFVLLHEKIDEFREFTVEGVLLKSLLLTLKGDLIYRASCASYYLDRMNSPPIQCYIHQFINELQADLEKVTAALGEYATVGVSTIGQEQARSSSGFTSMLTVSTLFSGITATALQMSTGRPEQNFHVLLTNLLWFMSLIFSVGVAFGSFMDVGWNERLLLTPRSSTLALVISQTMHLTQFFLLEASIVAFSAGLIDFAFASNQFPYTPYLVLSATFVILFLPLILMLSPWAEMLASPIAKSIKSSLAHKSPAARFTKHLSFLRLRQQNPTQDNVEKVEKKLLSEPEELPMQENNVPDWLRKKLQGGGKRVGVVQSALRGAFKTAGAKDQRGPYERQQQSKRIDGSSTIVPLTELILSDNPTSKIELEYYGAICDVAYSDDGKWLAVTCTKENTAPVSWTGIFDAETLTIQMDTFHEGRVISGHLKWSPSGRKLVVKFGYRFDVWNLDTRELHIMERDCAVQEVAWFGEDAFLVAENDCVLKMNLTEIMAVHWFEHTRVRSIALVREEKYLVLITNVAKSEGKSEPASTRSEKRVIIYDMDKREEIYLVPVLDDISSIYPIPGALDVLITHKDQKMFQPWSLDAGAEVMASLKKRVITQRPDAGEYIGPICLAGNHNQFILNVTTSGGIDIWQRETGTPHIRFESPILRDEGVHCLSWRRSNDKAATFVTAGVDSHTLLVWRGEERLVPNAPASPGPPIRLSPWPRVTHLGGVPSLGSLSSGGVVPLQGTVTESNSIDGLSSWSQLVLSM